jgi:hypothetical protein
MNGPNQCIPVIIAYANPELIVDFSINEIIQDSTISFGFPHESQQHANAFVCSALKAPRKS